MYFLADPDTYWLNITNITLGLATLVFILILARSAIRDLLKR
jgi:hypothetical protein